MKRLSEKYLVQWLIKPHRKPLIIRGARQVGKSTLVRHFAQNQKLNLVEINLEKHTKLDLVFKTKNIEQVLIELQTFTQHNLTDENTLIFLDEIQAVPSAIACLRYFYEEMPHIKVVAAGSLLEFALAQKNLSIPVGRVEYYHLGPMTFTEYLVARGEEHLIDTLKTFQIHKHYSQMAHDVLLQKQREFLFVGGMPEAVKIFIETKNMLQVQEVHQSILQTYYDDFSKYARTTDFNRLNLVLQSIPMIVGKKIKYSAISRDDKSANIKRVIDLLIRARVLLSAYHSDCSGLPLKACRNNDVYKLFFLDVGLFNSLCGTDWQYISQLDERSLVNEGVLAEQFVAQHLVNWFNGIKEPDLSYWLREGKAQNAEVDFVIAHSNKIIPIEVKAGKTGSLKSLQQFVVNKKIEHAIRFNLDIPSQHVVKHEINVNGEMKTAHFSLISLPLYFADPELLSDNIF